MTAPSWAEARKAEDAARYDVGMWHRVNALAGQDDHGESGRMLAEARATYRLARHASDVALVRRVLIWATQQDNEIVLDLSDNLIVNFTDIVVDPEAVLAEIQKEDTV